MVLVLGIRGIRGSADRQQSWPHFVSFRANDTKCGQDCSKTETVIKSDASITAWCAMLIYNLYFYFCFYSFYFAKMSFFSFFFFCSSLLYTPYQEWILIGWLESGAMKRAKYLSPTLNCWVNEPSNTNTLCKNNTLLQVCIVGCSVCLFCISIFLVALITLSGWI